MATSYQIKSTPFFRRMVTTSKKNGQLQRLKDEYERIKDFNERTIEMRMRQVRLKRLYKEIDDIRESAMSLNKKRRVNTERHKTSEELRVESIMRAKELGKEYSRLNALMFERRLVPLPLFFSTSPQIDPLRKENKKTKERIIKSIDYGNEISRFNIHKMSLKKEKRHKLSLKVPAGIIENKNENNDISNISGIGNDNDSNNHSNSNSHNYNFTNNASENNEMSNGNTKKLCQLKQRLQYGNSWSNLNLSKIPKRNKRHNIIAEQVSPSIQPSQPQSTVLMTQNVLKNYQNSTSNTALTPTLAEQQQERYLKSLEKLQNGETRIVGSAQTQTKEDAHERAQRHWRKVGLAVHNRADILRHRKLQQQRLHQQQLLHQQVATNVFNERFSTPPPGCIDETETERLNALQLQEQLLLEAAAANLPPEVEHELDSEAYDPDGSDYEELPLPPPPPPLDSTEVAVVEEDIELPPNEFEGNLDMPKFAIKVQNFIRPYETVVRAVAAKEALEFSVQSLRHIFEHKQ